MASQITIGIVEDSDEDFAIFQRLAKQTGQVHRWTCGEDALDAFSGDLPPARLSILFVDCNLPGIDGIDLVKAVRAIDGAENLKIVMISGSQAEGVSGRAVRAGVDRFERKGNSLADLRDALQRSFALLSTTPSNDAQHSTV